MVKGRIEDIVYDIQDGTAIAVSNGSYNPDTGRATFETRMENKQGTSQVKITQNVPGPEEHNSAYRAELAGIAASCIAIRAISRAYNIDQGKITICCDGKSALERAMGNWEININDNHHDLLQTIHQARDDLLGTVTMEPFWVKGHMDKKLPYYRLTRRQQLNVDCDIGAKQF